MKPKLLIIDDEVHIGEALTYALEDRYQVMTATNSQQALRRLEQQPTDLVLLDLRLGSEDGLEVLNQIKHHYPLIEIIIITAFGSIQSSVEAIKRGAFYYITKPLDLNELDIYLSKAHQKREALLAMQVIEEIPRDYDYIVGETPGIYQVLDLVEKIKDIDFTVLVTGESGTGKELIARAIHERGKRAAQPFEILNCAALPAQLLESELFGYEKGAFTGATASYPGKFLMANQGSLFLDEIGELDLSVQAKLLRVLQDKVVTPLGSTSSKKVDVRIITATNRNLKQDVAVGRFRSDLYYRLNVIEIKMPPLRQRKEDIPMLISFFMRDIARHLKQPVKHLSPAATMVLEHYSYPGNVRELKNILERAAVVSPTQVIELADLPPYLFELDTENQMVNDERFINISYGEPLDAVERKVILMNLSRLQRPRREIAQVLGISERTLRNKLREYSLQEPDE